MRIKEEKASQKTSVMEMIGKFFIFGILPISVISNWAPVVIISWRMNKEYGTPTVDVQHHC